MPFVDKIIKMKDFLDGLHERLKKGGDSHALIFFECFLQNDLEGALKEHTVPNWDGSVSAGDFDGMYPFAANMLHDAASSGYSEAHPDVYKDAHAVSVVFCEELNEIFECTREESFNLIPIKSYAEMMVEAGLIEAKDGFVRLTPKGKEVAENVEREIKKG